jgi:hypothetical protein
MDNGQLIMNDKADGIRRRYHYRRLILTGKVKLSRTLAVRFVGPDCAYHLYRTESGRCRPKD